MIPAASFVCADAKLSGVNCKYTYISWPYAVRCSKKYDRKKETEFAPGFVDVQIDAAG